MAINKNAYLRYQVLDRCFRNPGRRYFIEDLLSECNKALYELNGTQSEIKKRQLYDDIRFMESEQGWSIPLARHKLGKKPYYRYEDLTFSINNQPINETDIRQLKDTLMILSRFKGMPHFDWMQELIPRLEQSLKMALDTKTIISFDNNIFLKGLEFIEPLFNHIQYQKALNISYRPFRSDTIQQHEIHPYFLKQYRNRWFLLGYNPEYKDISNLALDRIIKIEVTEEKYIVNGCNRRMMY